MAYFINTYRVPKPGLFTDVVSGMAESLKATNRLGYINMQMSPQRPSTENAQLTGTVAGFETLDDVDAFFDDLLANDMAGLSSRNSLASNCDSFNMSISELMTPMWTPPEGFNAKIVERASVSAKPGKEFELIDALTEWATGSDFPAGKFVSVMIGGERGLVRLTHIVESLQSLHDLRQELRASVAAKGIGELVDPPAMREVGRITFMNMP